MRQFSSPDSDWREERRRRAFQLKDEGWTQREIAEIFGVSEAAVSQWFSRNSDNSGQPWCSVARSGRPPKLSSEQLQTLPQLLLPGAESYGFLGDIWTCERIKALIAQEFDVSYSKAQVSRLLKQLGWTPQIPMERAAQRDENKIEQWRQARWPEIKKRRRKKARP